MRIFKKEPNKTIEEQKVKQVEKNRLSNKKLELLVTVVNREKADFYMDLIQSFDVNMQLMSHGHGTSNSLKDLSLPEVEKAVIFSVVKSEKVEEILSSLETKFKTIRNGKGISYTIPMTSIIGSLIYSFLSNNTGAIQQ